MNYQNNVVEGQSYRIFFYKIEDGICDEVFFVIRNGELMSDEEIISRAFYELFKDNHSPDQYNDENLEKLYLTYKGAAIVNRSYLMKTEKNSYEENIIMKKCMFCSQGEELKKAIYMGKEVYTHKECAEVNDDYQLNIVEDCIEHKNSLSSSFEGAAIVNRSYLTKMEGNK